MFSFDFFFDVFSWIFSIFILNIHGESHGESFEYTRKAHFKKPTLHQNIFHHTRVAKLRLESPDSKMKFHSSARFPTQFLLTSSRPVDFWQNLEKTQHSWGFCSLCTNKFLRAENNKLTKCFTRVNQRPVFSVAIGRRPWVHFWQRSVFFHFYC